MNTPSEDHDWMRWIDGEMTPSERAAFEKRLEAEPELRERVALGQAMSAALKKELPAEMEVPHGDFFNSQIQVRIAQEDADARRREAASGAKSAGIWSWLGQPWVLGAAAAVALAAVWLERGPVEGSAGTTSTWVGASYAPNPSVQATAYHSDAAGATVLMLEGLEEIPAQKKVAGIRVGRTEVDPATATASFFSPSGEVLLVMSRDARQNPRLWAPRTLAQ